MTQRRIPEPSEAPADNSRGPLLMANQAAAKVDERPLRAKYTGTYKMTHTAAQDAWIYGSSFNETPPTANPTLSYQFPGFPSSIGALTALYAGVAIDSATATTQVTARIGVFGFDSNLTPLFKRTTADSGYTFTGTSFQIERQTTLNSGSSFNLSIGKIFPEPMCEHPYYVESFAVEPFLKPLTITASLTNFTAGTGGFGSTVQVDFEYFYADSFTPV